MWQGANRIMADSLDLDRDKDNKTKRGLIARGNVVTNFWETPKAAGPPANVPAAAPTGAVAKTAAPPASKTSAAPTKAVAAAPIAAAPGRGAPPVQTVVRSENLVYTDENRLAVYTGGVTLVRPGLREKSKELRTYLAESGADSRLEKAIADGGVEIVQTAPDHTRVGTAEHCEYLVSDDKVTLNGGKPGFHDTCKGIPCGGQQVPEGGVLTYLADEGTLIADAPAGQMVQSRIIHQKKKK
jgi:lipopolysaccharide export system protein LptA